MLISITVAAAVSFALGMYQDFGPQHDPDEPRVNWVEGVAISALTKPFPNLL
jgi:Ca2+-transporting ATPase